jgi:hypothetical protein
MPFRPMSVACWLRCACVADLFQDSHSSTEAAPNWAPLCTFKWRLCMESSARCQAPLSAIISARGKAPRSNRAQ